MDAAPPCCIYLLGGLRVEVGNDVVTRFRTQKTGALLAYLALHVQRAHSREELADLFWPDIDPEAARANLRSALSSLRRQIEPPASVASGSVLVTRGRFEVYLNAASVGVDAVRFDRAIQSANRATTPNATPPTRWKSVLCSPRAGVENKKRRSFSGRRRRYATLSVFR